MSDKYGEKIADAILKNEVIVDMPAEAVMLALGEPENKNIIDKSEFWHYKNKDVTFSNGSFIYISE